MTLPIVLGIAGCIALLIGLFGGGVKAKEIEVPKISVLARIFSSLVGIVLIAIAIWLPNPLPSVELPIGPTDTPIPRFGWAVYFEIEFKRDYWKPGTNSYKIIADCPNVEFLEDIDTRIEFAVDENARLFRDEVVEFHFFGIPSPNKGELNLSSINPNQKTKIVLGYTNISLEQGAQAVKECQVKAIINDKWTLQMSPIGPTPE